MAHKTNGELNPFGGSAIPEDEEENFADGASTPETVDEELEGFTKDVLDPGTSGKNVGGEAGGTGTFEMTVNHSKLLILISKFAQVALSADDQETWLRQLSLHVLIYEGIAAGQLDYDYSPQSVFVSYDGSSRRIYLNVSQEGKAAVDELREQKLINGLKISTEDFQPITAYQVALKGLQFLKTLPNSLFEEVNSFVYAPNAPHYDTELLESSFDGQKFVLRSKSGFQRDSLVTMTEDVSYVGSPYLPACLRTRWGRPLSDNSQRANECAAGHDNVRDELSEAVHLSYVCVLVGEWVPYGANFMVQLNQRLGSLEPIQGGMFTALQDKNPMSTNFKVPPGLTNVDIIDFSLARFVNFESEISFPEEGGILQVENFGMHINVDGTVLQGMKIEAVMDRRADNVSLDLLSRVLVDIQMDSSRIMDDLFTTYQRSLMDMLFMGDTSNRTKYNCIMAEGISPKMSAKVFMGRSEFENEMKQVLGDIFLAEDIGADDIVVMGRQGLLIAGPNVQHLEPLVIYYTSLMCKECFVQNYFTRTFILNDTLKKIRMLIEQHHTDPENVKRIRLALSEAAGDIIHLEETLSYLREALQDMLIPQLPSDAKSKRLYRIFNCAIKCEVIKASVMDLGKLVAGSAHQLENLQQVCDVINTNQLEKLYIEVESNTKVLVDAGAALERSGAALSVMNVVLAGSLAFMLLDKGSSTWVNAAPADWFVTYIVKPFIDPPGVFFVFNLSWMSLICYALYRYMLYATANSSGTLSLRVQINKKIRTLAQLESYLESRDIIMTDCSTDPTSSTMKATWEETDRHKWLGACPNIEMIYDCLYHFILTCSFTVDAKRSNATQEDLLNILLLDLVECGALDKEVAFGDKADDVEMQQQQMRARYEASKKTAANLLRGNKAAKVKQ